MRYIVLVICLLSLGLGVSCRTQKLAGGGASGSAAGGKFERIRVAVEEHRFTDAAACKAAATFYNNNNRSEDANGQIQEFTTPSLVYSWKAKSIDVEIRFVVLPADEVKQPGEVIQYWEINKRTGNHEKDIKDAIREFGDKRNWRIVKDANQDANEINGKRAWRAVLSRDLPNSPSSKDSFRALRAEEFGIIINPPYP